MTALSKLSVTCCTIAFFLIAVPQSIAAQTSSGRICAAATAYLSRTGAALPGRAILAAASLAGDWKTSIATPLAPGTLRANQNVDHLFVAYFRAAAPEQPGVVSIRIALKAGPNELPTNLVEIVRPAIPRGTNRCESRGRPELNDTVRVNQYIDYHDRGGTSSSMENFHFRYPVNVADCARTDNPFTRQSFAFENVTPTRGDTLIGRLFPIIGTAYAVTHQYSRLRSELHYRSTVQPGAICVGFNVLLKGREPVSIVVNDHGFGAPMGVVGRAWVVQR